jgi:very-short-patch-repair endonuclease
LKEAVIGRKLILTEDSFKEIFIDSQLTKEEAFKLCGVSYNVYRASKFLYLDKFKDALRIARSRNHAKALLGNKRGQGVVRKGIKHEIKTILDYEELKYLVNLGLSNPEIARRLKTTEYHVKRNLNHHDIHRDITLPKSLQDIDSLEYKFLDSINPDFLKNARAFYSDPYTFFESLYKTLIKVYSLIEVLREFKPSHDYYIDSGKLERDHISFSLNRGEMKLSEALLSANIPHVRGKCVYKNWSADFSFKGTRLLVEVDGPYHVKDAATRKRDKRKQKKLEQLGYVIKRYPVDTIFKNLDLVVEEIKCLLSQPLNQLSQ